MEKIGVGEYLHFNTLAQRDSVLVNKRQPCLQKLKQWKSMKPIPPLIFGSASFFQDIQCRVLLSRELPHQFLTMQDVRPLPTLLVTKTAHIIGWDSLDN